MSKRRSQPDRSREPLARRPRPPRRRAGRPSRADEARLLALIGRIDDRGFDWDDVADDVLPIFERARPFGFEVDPPAQAIVPPGVTVGFGVDLGLAFARVSVVHLDELAGRPRRPDRARAAEPAQAGAPRRRLRPRRGTDRRRADDGLPVARRLGVDRRSSCPRRSSGCSGASRPCSSRRRGTCWSGCRPTSTSSSRPG